MNYRDGTPAKLFHTKEEDFKLMETIARNEYDTQAETFLIKTGIKFLALRTDDNKCPLWDDEKHIHGDEYKITLKRKGGRSILFRFWNSKTDADRGLEPRAYDFLTCITKNDPDTFENFCSEFGYDTDSRRAETTYKAVKKEWEKVSKFFSPAEIEALQEIQ